jgi:hypothetical protein
MNDKLPLMESPKVTPDFMKTGFCYKCQKKTIITLNGVCHYCGSSDVE